MQLGAPSFKVSTAIAAETTTGRKRVIVRTNIEKQELLDRIFANIIFAFPLMAAKVSSYTTGSTRQSAIIKLEHVCEATLLFPDFLHH
jgi:hypothetical protein